MPAPAAPQQQPQPTDGGMPVPTYPSLAFNPAGPSQPHPGMMPQQWFPPPVFSPQYPGPHGGGPRQPNGGGFQPGQFHGGFQGYNIPPQFYYGGLPMPGPGPGSMQNGYYPHANYDNRPYGGYPDGGDDPKFAHPGGDDGVFHPNGHGVHHTGFPPPQTFYPPGHPYAYGGGVGYQQFPGAGGQFNRMGGGGGYRPDGYVPEQVQAPPAPAPPPPSSGKALNPAAAGFNYVPPSRKVSVPNGGGANGHDTQTPAPPAAPVTPETTEPPAAELPAPATSSLGLSLEPLEPVAEVSPEPAKTEAKPVEDKTTVVSEETASAPKITPAAAESTPSAPSLTFTGDTVVGYTSPPPKQAAPTPRRPQASDPIHLRPSRPAHDSAVGNSYSQVLASFVPATVTTEHFAGVALKRSTRGQSAPKGKAVFVLGAAGGRPLPALSLVFGIISEPAMPPTPTPAVKAAAVAAAPAAAPRVKPAAPAAKPSSWAALLRNKEAKATGTPDSLSVAPSSTLPSPSKSTSSLPSAQDGPSTPKSATGASLPPSTGPAPAQPRPAFNYAAAAAVGAPPTPAEDLARLLTDGLRIRPSHPIAPVVPRGLINTGNMCYANTILQVLVYCPPFTELFDALSKRLKADLARRTPLLEAMIVFLREFAPGPSNSGASTPKGKGRDTKNAFVPENVYDAMKENKRFDTMRRGFQEDAQEYLGFFLDTLHEEMLGLYSRTLPPRTVSKPAAASTEERTIDRPLSPGANDNGGDDWLEVGKKQKTHVVRTAETKDSAVSRVFGGTVRSTLHTPGQKDSVSLEPYQPLQLDIQAKEVLTLVDALRHLHEPEVIQGVWSAARGANVDATKQLSLDSFPPVLILHLKRFVYDSQEQDVVKRSKPISYPSELVIPQEIISPSKRTAQSVKYRLFGVVYHHGHSATGGHYTVAVARPDGSGWLHFDDELVQPVPIEDVVVSEEEARNGNGGLIANRERCAYLLFYQRLR
ncbi:hypothetical protein Q8F55_000993 [Vanrija albida]|uniref:ubiquitinyl hydrolase 1 n=1 Tax=Vanrija albida TaxID=181172 RepID=A0ABR3QEU6_9TREE